MQYYVHVIIFFIVPTMEVNTSGIEPGTSFYFCATVLSYIWGYVLIPWATLGNKYFGMNEMPAVCSVPLFRTFYIATLWSVLNLIDILLLLSYLFMQLIYPSLIYHYISIGSDDLKDVIFEPEFEIVN